MEQLLLLNEGLAMGVAFLFACMVSYLSIPVIISAAEKKHLFDHPDNDRKLHSEAIPTLGGIAIFFAFLLTFALSPWAAGLEGFSYLVAALLILFFVGLKDDLVIISAKKKLVAQLVAAGLVVFGSDILISNFHGVFGLAEIPYWFAVPITFFTIIVVINAVNLIDGIDGLAGGIGAIASLLFGITFWYTGHLPMAVFSFCLTGALAGFLYHNFSPASIFMGDTGSMLLGFLLGIQAIEFIGLSGEPAFVSIFGNASPILPVAILGFPLYDTLRVVLRRVRRKKSIFEPGQDHVHHELLRMGFSHKNASLLLYGKSLILAVAISVLAMFSINVNILLGAVIVGSLLIFPTNGMKRKILTSLFGVDWLAFRSQRWGIEFDNEKSSSQDINQPVPEKEFEVLAERSSDEKEEEIDSIAV
ncbi:MraY family glycosyltransferase [Fodinibius halophilus]|uniref:Undecaprenyl/decaprenyl-phosphate alpha-N-acetylglucosaminyl 1-phosphate transferase n=1 Tax=Fodinibius halophilus TaxID=1736908 RepID=A0A6M1T9N5_9BACT|nr:MraY family glycosyltransferase [Fodinibius halophilus]NGP90195.1 undecaprenyl/decaprenyl-phosphate alpha-N-acetylglucosaminyl 1-phosphate transferase [Fodinibius halophilus]